MTLTQKEIARQFDVSPGHFNAVLKGRAHTCNVDLAVYFSKLLGKPAIEFIGPSRRRMYELKYPRLGKAV